MNDLTVPKARLPKTPAPPKTQRTVAKAGMSAAMGVLVWTALRRSRKTRAYHALAGVALLAFTAWHMTLYKSNAKKFEN